MSNLAARVLVAMAFLPCILSLLYIVHPIGMFLLVAATIVVASIELFGMMGPAPRAGPARSHGAAPQDANGERPRDSFALAYGAIVSVGTSAVVYWFPHDARVLLTLMIGVPLLGLIAPLVRLGDLPTAALRSATFAFGPLYCGIPLTFLAILRRDVHPGFVLLALMIAWFGDTGGYFAGRFLGKRALYEAVSPNKTIAGALGSLAGSVVGALSASLFYLKGELPIAHAIPLALVGGALGQAGDLAESLLKRSTGVKDSGGILPGHGGILDRIDALVFTASAVYLYTLWR